MENSEDTNNSTGSNTGFREIPEWMTYNALAIQVVNNPNNYAIEKDGEIYCFDNAQFNDFEATSSSGSKIQAEQWQDIQGQTYMCDLSEVFIKMKKEGYRFLERTSP